MGFFSEFPAWLNGLLSSYIGTNTARIASVLEPAVVTLGVLYVMIWGYLQLAGKVEEPFVFGLKRLFTLAVVLGVALPPSLYNRVVAATFFVPPSELPTPGIEAFVSVGALHTKPLIEA